MSAYSGGGSGSGETHIPRMISGKKAVPTKIVPAKVVKKPAKKARGK